jgi:hypothetical protein
MEKVRLELEFESMADLQAWVSKRVEQPKEVVKQSKGRKLKVSDDEIVDYLASLKRRTTLTRLCRHFKLAVGGGNWDRMKQVINKNKLRHRIMKVEA